VAVNIAQNKLLWTQYLGAGPQRAAERFEGYTNSKGFSAAGHCALAILESITLIGRAIYFLYRLCSSYRPNPKIQVAIAPILTIKAATKKGERKIAPLLPKQGVSMKPKNPSLKNEIKKKESMFYLFFLHAISQYIEKVCVSMTPLELRCKEQEEKE
jgi:hypothetical protein